MAKSKSKWIKVVWKHEKWEQVISGVRQAQDAMMEVTKPLEFTERDMKLDNNITNGNLQEIWRKSEGKY